MRATTNLSQSRKNIGDLFDSVITKQAALQIVYFAVGILVSRGTVFAKYAPFGVALAAAAPFGNVIAVLAGTIIGYLLPSAVQEGIRYLAAIIAVVAIRWTLNDLVRVRSHALFAPLVAMVPMLATGLAMSTVNGFTTAAVVMSVTESLLAAGGAYFFSATAHAVAGSRGITTFNQQQLACVALTCCILVLSFADVTVGTLSIGRIAAILAILFCARYGSVAGGSIAGIAAGIVFSLSSAEFSYISGAYAFGGLMAGLFSPIGRVATAAAFILSNAILALQTGDSAEVIAGLYEVMAATLIFVLLPKNTGDKLSMLFSQNKEQPSAEGMRRSVIMRLDFASKALSDVSDSVEKVSQKLGKLSAPSIGGVFNKVFEATCSHCGLKTLCWEKDYNNTMGVFNDVTHTLRTDGKIRQEDFPPYFIRRCSKGNEVTECVNRFYNEYSAREAAERRVREVRAAVSDQFSGMGEMLRDMADELKLYERFDFAIAEKVIALLHTKGCLPIDVSCRIDKHGRMSLEIEAAKEEYETILSKTVLTELARICDRMLDTPCVSSAPDRCRIQICERTAFRVRIGCAQHVCNNGGLCGDNYDYFNDGMGRTIVVISDGMGTGGRAAVDGAMAAGILSKLAKAGLGFDCALRIVNSALAVKSGDESLATLDVACIDLFSGMAEFKKAGAPVTMVRKQGKVIRVDAPSLPAGILNEISFASEKIQLNQDDWILMVSDGAVANGDEWLAAELLAWKGSEKDLAKHIIQQAAARRTDGHDDDVTAIAMEFERFEK